MIPTSTTTTTVITIREPRYLVGHSTRPYNTIMIPQVSNTYITTITISDLTHLNHHDASVIITISITTTPQSASAMVPATLQDINTTRMISVRPKSTAKQIQLNKSRSARAAR